MAPARRRSSTAPEPAYTEYFLEANTDDGLRHAGRGGLYRSRLPGIRRANTDDGLRDPDRGRPRPRPVTTMWRPTPAVRVPVDLYGVDYTTARATACWTATATACATRPRCPVVRMRRRQPRRGGHRRGRFASTAGYRPAYIERPSADVDDGSCAPRGAGCTTLITSNTTRTPTWMTVRGEPGLSAVRPGGLQLQRWLQRR